MTIGRLAPAYQGRILLPVLGKVSATRFTDRVQVRLVSGQSAADFAARAANLAHGFGAVLCRVQTIRPGALVLEFVRRDALTNVIPALPIPAHVDLRALPVGRREDGQPWLVRVHGTHVLIAGATGAGKASLLWSIVRAMLPAMAAGLVRVWAADPKLMELAYGREVFHRYAARRILDVAARKRNGARWSVALALGIRQGEALGLRWSYVDLETGVIRAWFQIQRIEWQHGCDNPGSCSERWHRHSCKPRCKKHRHLPTCKPDCTINGHVCYKRPCPPDCTGHAAKCPNRIGGGVVFRQRKGKGKLTLQCPPALLELLKEHRKRQAAGRLKGGQLMDGL